MSYNTKRGSKVPAKRSSFKSTHVKPYSPPANKTNPVSSPTGGAPGSILNTSTSAAVLPSAPSGNSGSGVTSPSNSHVRARTYAANRNNKITALANEAHILEKPTNFSNNNNKNAILNGNGSSNNNSSSKKPNINDGLGMISENNANSNNNNSKSVALKKGDFKGVTYKQDMNGMNSGKSGKSSKHIPSQSIAVMSGGQSQETLEKFRNELRDVIWTEANVMDGKAGYRMYIWKHMAKNIWLPTASDLPAKFKYESYKERELPSEEEKGGAAGANTAMRARVTTQSTSHSHTRQRSDNIEDLDANNDENSSFLGEYITFEKLSMYLRRRETYGHFIEDPNSVVFVDPFEHQMKNVLTAYAVANHNRFPLVGVVQLCAVILTTTKKEADTFYLLQILTLIMREYYHNDEEAIKNETLLLVDILCTNDQELVNHLKSKGIDVIDLSMLTCNWVRSLFSQHFLLPFIKRVIDLVLLEGPSVLTAIVYGIFCLMKNDLCQCESDNEIFDMLSGTKLKEFLKQSQFMNQVILKAQLLHGKSNNKFISLNRNIKSWTEMIKLPGNKYFRLKSGVGDERRTKKELKSVNKNGFDMFDQSKNGLGGNDIDFDSDTDSDTENIETGLKKKLKDAQQQIAGLKGEIERFQSMHLDPTALGLTASQSLGHSPGYSLSVLNTMNNRVRTQNSVEFHEDGSNGMQSQITEGVDEDGNNINNNNNNNSGNNFGQLAQLQEEQQRMINSMTSLHEASSQIAQSQGSILINHSASLHSSHSHNRTIADLLHMSIDGTEIYLEPLAGDDGNADSNINNNNNVNATTSSSNAREIQCRTENWTYGWKHALSTLNDVSITMSGYLCKMTASKWNTRGTFEKVQRRWFVLRGHYLTYFKTHHHQAPKGDKCISILGYTINPVQHSKSKYAFEVISPPKETRYSKDSYLREKFIILPDCDIPESQHKTERNKWIKALRLASKGSSLWDPLIGVNAYYGSGGGGSSVGQGSMLSNRFDSGGSGLSAISQPGANGANSNGVGNGSLDSNGMMNGNSGGNMHNNGNSAS